MTDKIYVECMNIIEGMISKIPELFKVAIFYGIFKFYTNKIR